MIPKFAKVISLWDMKTRLVCYYLRKTLGLFDFEFWYYPPFFISEAV